MREDIIHRTDTKENELRTKLGETNEISKDMLEIDDKN